MAAFERISSALYEIFLMRNRRFVWLSNVLWLGWLQRVDKKRYYNRKELARSIMTLTIRERTLVRCI